MKFKMCVRGEHYVGVRKNSKKKMFWSVCVQ